MLLSHEIQGPQNAGALGRGKASPLYPTPPYQGALWTPWGPKPLVYFTLPNSKAGSTPGFDTGARSHPQPSLCVS